ncbi:MAG: RNA-guided pseudouridylation complex pseudouridine synthase subunit Cbf5 [Candidatus Aenigmatarchaeota archaeon]
MWLIKSEEETDPEYGKRPEERSLEELIKSSVVIVDKHPGPTSHQITQWTKEIFGVKKAGHAGTLDPAVTGVLPVALGNATKAMPVLMGLEKEYVGVMHLHKEVPEDLLREVTSSFVGKIVQVPPVKSAVARRPREREIKFFDIVEREGKDVLFHVGCEAGTYIRKLVHQIGERLGVGAHMTELRRIRVGNFKEEQAHSLVEIRDAYEFWKNGNEKKLREILIPIEHAILHVKKIFVKDSAIDSICHGAPLFVSGITRIQEGIARGETVAIYSLKEELVALGIAKMTSEEMYEKNKGLAVRTDRVLMEKGVYPKKSSR